MLTGGQRDAVRRNGLPGMPAVRIGNSDRTAHVHAVHFHVHPAQRLVWFEF